jgi:hypothetical protein
MRKYPSCDFVHKVTIESNRHEYFLVQIIETIGLDSNSDGVRIN